MWFIKWLFDLFQTPSARGKNNSRAEDEAEEDDEDDEDDEAPGY